MFLVKYLGRALPVHSYVSRWVMYRAPHVRSKPNSCCIRVSIFFLVKTTVEYFLNAGAPRPKHYRNVVILLSWRFGLHTCLDHDIRLSRCSFNFVSQTTFFLRGMEVLPG